MVNTDDIIKIVKDTGLKHIAVIMDGNRRWAKEKNLPSAIGHKKGVDSLRAITKSCLKFGIKYLTVYAFSTENWKRTTEEVNFLMELLSATIKSEISSFIKNDIKLTFIGNRENLNKEIIKILEYGEKVTDKCSSLNLQIAFNYGSRQEITDAVKRICTEVQKGKIQIENITETEISNNLYTKNIPNPDLLIRTGGEKRISNYLLWQCAYTEIYITETFWPDFDENSFSMAIEDFNKRQRRYGK